MGPKLGAPKFHVFVYNPYTAKALDTTTPPPTDEKMI